MNRWELENLSDDDSYDDHMKGFLNSCDLDDSSDDESDKCDNVNNNKDWIHKGLDHVEGFIEEDNYDKNLITDDEMSDLIGGYKSDDSSTEG